MASHDFSNTKPTILGATPGVIPGIYGNPHEIFSFAPPFSERFFENWGGPRAPDFQRFPGCFPDIPGSPPNFPGSSLDLPTGQPLSFGNPTPSDDSHKAVKALLNLMQCALAMSGIGNEIVSNYHWGRNYYILYSEKIKSCKNAGLHYSD